ncbi:hypothetical protein NDU88_003134 [Pleurodeles waltl]|uniref:Uncharacterized protein n=1 Tax=Pleurodeles waltl TaxID=8319 RepID=A0AAV7M4D8_PLEWA|nr:hypothetical protein NDU88_003134 [Pleurodeles waltl]
MKGTPSDTGLTMVQAGVLSPERERGEIRHVNHIQAGPSTHMYILCSNAMTMYSLHSLSLQEFLTVAEIAQGSSSFCPPKVVTLRTVKMEPLHAGYRVLSISQSSRSKCDSSFHPVIAKQLPSGHFYRDLQSEIFGPYKMFIRIEIRF